MSHTRKTHPTNDVIVIFARAGIALYTIARAIAISVETVEAVCKSAVASGELQMVPPRSPEEHRGAMLAEVTNLRAQLLDLQTLFRELQNAQRDTHTIFVGIADMTATEAAVVGVLVRRGRVSKARLYGEIYGMRTDEHTPEPKILDVIVCKCRKKLAAHGVKIGTLYAAGWEMTTENIAKLRALLPLPTVDAPSLAPSATEMVM